MTIRKFNQDDVEPFLEYMNSNSEEFYRSIGVDKNKIDTGSIRKKFEEQIQSHGSVNNLCIIEFQNRRIGHHNINNVVPNESAVFHGQIWERDLRGNGLGRISGIKAIDHFFKYNNFKKIFLYVPKINQAATRALEKFKIPPARTAFYEFAMMLEPLDCFVYEATQDQIDELKLQLTKL